MQALIDQLQGKIKSYKKQIEEAEEIAALNLAQNNVADAGDRAQSSEQALAKNRARARSASIGPRRSPPSTLPSTGRPRTMWLMLATALKPRSRLSPRTALGLAVHPLGRCKKLKLKKKKLLA